MQACKIPADLDVKAADIVFDCWVFYLNYIVLYMRLDVETMLFESIFTCQQSEWETIRRSCVLPYFWALKSLLDVR